MLIKNTRIYAEKSLDIRIKDGKISQIGHKLKAQNNEKIFDANDFICLPSFIDLNINIKNDSFSLDNLNLLEKECIQGGFSTIVLRDKMDFDEQSLALFLNHLKNFKINILASVRVLDQNQKLKNISTLLSNGAIALELKSNSNANILKQSMQYALMKNAKLFVKCYDEGFDDNGVMNDSITSFNQGLVGMSEICELSEVAKIKQIAKFYKVKIIYDNLSLNKSLNLLDDDELIQISIHNLLKSDKECEYFNTFAKLTPPLRDEKECQALKNALKNGKITFLSSAHSPKSIIYKDVAFDEAKYGIHSLHEYLSLCNSFFVKNGFLSWRALCNYTSLNQAKFLNINSGEIKEGKDANLILFDENSQINTPTNSLYAKDKLYGKLKAHFINGQRLI